MAYFRFKLRKMEFEKLNQDLVDKKLRKKNSPVRKNRLKQSVAKRKEDAENEKRLKLLKEKQE